MAAPASSTQHIDAAKRRLVHLSGLAGKTEATERRILDAGRERLAAVAAELDRLRPQVNVDQAAAGRYQDLTLERGQLSHVIAQAQQAIP